MYVYVIVEIDEVVCFVVYVIGGVVIYVVCVVCGEVYVFGVDVCDSGCVFGGFVDMVVDEFCVVVELEFVEFVVDVCDGVV